MKAHVGTQGNEKAVQLAKEEAVRKTSGIVTRRQYYEPISRSPKGHCSSNAQSRVASQVHGELIRAG